jgi:hypothetical protein
MLVLLQQFQEVILILLIDLFKYHFRCRVGKVGHRHFLPFGRADLDAPALTSTRE